ncbi:MAG: OsmC family protein [Nocardioidaceae bacterium]|nr:OsmC family protein [Nocardioidaceae bacterium]
MSQHPDAREVRIERIGQHRYKATNRRGGVVTLGSGADPDFTPVELLLAAIAGCSAVDVDMITGKRVDPEVFRVLSEGLKVRDEDGNRLADLKVTFEVTFPEGPDGDRARAMVPRAIGQSRDRLCSVGRTVMLGTPVDYGEGLVGDWVVADPSDVGGTDED